MKKTLATLLAGSALLAAGTAAAQVPEGNWLIRGRVVNIAPNESNNATGGGLIGEDSIKVDNRWAPEVDITYFFTRNFAVELVLTYPQKHDVEWSGSALTTPPGGTLPIGDIKQLPPTLLAQYHFPLANGVKPYVGAGVTPESRRGQRSRRGEGGMQSASETPSSHRWSRPAMQE